MKMKKTFLLSAVALAVLGACTNDEYEGRDMAGSKLAVSASINEVRTRVSDNGTDWTTGDVIGVSDDQANANTNVPYATANGDGVFAPVGESIYVLGGNEINFSAYYPYDAELSGNAISFNVTEEGNHDYMYASTTANRENPNAAFTFNHMMTKLTFTFKAGTGATEGTALTWAVNGVTVDGTFDVTTGTVTAGSTKGNIGKSTTVGATSSVILPPLAEANTESVIFSLTIGEKYYEGTITPALAASTDYQYNIDLSQLDEGEPLNISQPTLNGWTPSEEGGITLEESAPKNAVIEVGDFYLNDGTTIDKTVVLTAEMKEKVVGVVFYAGNPQPSVLYAGTEGYDAENDLLLRDFPNCTNGLVLSLPEEKGSHFCDTDLTTTGLMNTWFMTQAEVPGIYSARYAWDEASSAVGTSGANSDAENNILGYNNTYLWKQFAQAKSVDVTALNTLAAYAEAHPLPEEQTSGWYIPSSGEMQRLVVSDGAETSVYAPQADLAASLEQLGYTELFQEARYWTSTEGRISDGKASSMSYTFYKNDAYQNAISATANSTTGWFFYAFAF